MNGDILAQSVEGRGSLLTLEFQAGSLSSPESLHSRPSADPEPAAFDDSPLAGATILGDGTVGFILDVRGMLEITRRGEPVAA